MGPREVERFVTHLANANRVSSSTQRQALSAILFLYRNVLHIELELERMPRAKYSRRLPVVLTRKEVQAVLRLANENRTPVVPRGAGTSLAGNAVPARGGIVLDTSRISTTFRPPRRR